VGEKTPGSGYIKKQAAAEEEMGDSKKFADKVSEKLKKANSGVLIRLCIPEKNPGILKKAEDILKKNIREADVLCRIEENEFAIFMELPGEEYISKVVDRIYRLFLYPVEGIRVFINAGISVYPSDGEEFEELFEKSGTALKEALKEGIDAVKFYSQTLEKEKAEKFKTNELIEKAIKEDLFTYFYQPFFKAENLEVAGFEALLRIVEKDGKVHPAADFIKTLEKHPYMGRLEEKLVRTALKNSEKWGLPVAVNISERGFISGNFLKYLIEHCKSECKIIIEIVERALIKSHVHYIDVLEKLKDTGLKVAVDDFGAGYSLLAYLRDFPFDMLKIDRSFTKDLPHNNRARLIFELIVQLSRDLGVEVCAEGIEKEEQLEFVKKVGCDYVQGFLFSEPMSEEEVEKKFSFRKTGH
jgi:EAL domain-containing protein (putative c-di-GMP-specific phosphodiesterase class I)